MYLDLVLVPIFSEEQVGLLLRTAAARSPRGGFRDEGGVAEFCGGEALEATKRRGDFCVHGTLVKESLVTRIPS